MHKARPIHWAPIDNVIVHAVRGKSLIATAFSNEVTCRACKSSRRFKKDGDRYKRLAANWCTLCRNREAHFPWEGKCLA